MLRFEEKHICEYIERSEFFNCEKIRRCENGSVGKSKYCNTHLKRYGVYDYSNGIFFKKELFTKMLIYISDDELKRMNILRN